MASTVRTFAELSFDSQDEEYLIRFLAKCASVSLALGLPGFGRRATWFISYGYTLSIACFCALTAIVHPHSPLSWISYTQLTILAIWAIRLGFFIAQRDGSPQYQTAVREQVKKAQSLSLFVKINIWWSVSLLYCTMFAPAAIVATRIGLASVRGSPVLLRIAVTGLTIQGGGLLLEVTADRQKAAFKREHPFQCMCTGLFRFVRYPNYLGEVLVWTGNFVVGVSCYHRIWHWVATTLGLACIILVMVGSTKRLESKQYRRYGNNEDFRKWVASVPILVPFWPIYSLQSTRVYLE